ncbi:hypothetical protein B0A49_06605 [Cryomyces minteri]|uniref:Uncharacterized protein n=1 Tax=Cryomyces minteri TaxID=331657 RepID=A0A4U0WZR3_9PEZI|nr:hypothetical protein B0A49_06605 [Cryomyces minteri]
MLGDLLPAFPTGSTARDITLPTPSLVLDFRMSVTLNPKISVGKGIWGQRNWISFTGGRWSATWGQGTVVPGGQDSQLVLPDLSTHLETNYLLQTTEDLPAYIAVQTRGWRTGPSDVLAKLFDPQQADGVGASEYCFRVTIQLETGDERHAHVNTGMWLGSGARRGAEE